MVLSEGLMELTLSDHYYYTLLFSLSKMAPGFYFFLLSSESYPSAFEFAENFTDTVAISRLSLALLLMASSLFGSVSVCTFSGTYTYNRLDFNVFS